MPEGFRYPLRTDVWRPLLPNDSLAGPMTLLGRLKPGASRQQLAGELSVIARRLARADSEQYARLSFTQTEMVDRGTSGAALRIAFLFVGAAAFVLLIACGNVVNLFLVRAAERRGEMAVRASLGASRSRLLLHGLTEAFLLSGFAAAIGTALSALVLKVVIPVIVPSQGLPSWVHFSLDGRILSFSVVVSVLVSLAVGMSPALEGARPNLMRTLKIGGDRMLSRGGVGKRARAGIVVQLTFSVTLLAGALLFARSYQHVSNVDVGYPASKILEAVWFFGDQNDTAQRVFAKELLRRVRALPGVSDAAIRDGVGAYAFVERAKSKTRGRREVVDTRLYIDGQLASTRATAETRATPIRGTAISEDYFHTLGLHVVAGRGILATDGSGQEKVAVVSRQFAKTFWGGESPIGHTINYGSGGALIRVVGVVDDVRDVRGGRDGISANPIPDVYFSDEQASGYRSLVFRSDGDVNALRIPVERIVRELDPMKDLRIDSMNKGVEETQLVSKIFGGLLFCFAISGLVLSLIGIYGIVAYGITERTREIGIRLALGGTSGDVIQMIVRSSLRFIAIGLGVGLVMSQGTNRLLGRLIYDVSPADPLTYAIVFAVFGGVGLLSAYLPARRVSRVDPVIALRAE
jgi:predicted permease